MVFFVVFYFYLEGAAAYQENEMEHVQDESDHSSPRMTSRYRKLPGAKVQPERQDDLSFSASCLQEPHTSKAENKETRILLNGCANHVSDSDDSSCQEENRHGDDDRDENNNDDDNNFEIKCSEDEVCDNGNDNFNDGNNDDDDNDNGDDDDDDDHGKNSNNMNFEGYRSQEPSCLHEEDVSLLSDRVNESVTLESSSSLRVSNENNDEISNTDNVVGRTSSSNNSSITRVNAYNRNVDGSRSENHVNGEVLAPGVTNFSTNEINRPIASVAGNFTSQGARPKTSLQTPVLSNVNRPGYYSDKIPSLEVAGINQGFLARHTTDQSLPYSSCIDDRNLSVSESTSLGNWPQTSITSNGSFSTPWSLSRPPAPERSMLIQERAYSGGVNPWYSDPVHVGYHVAPSGWQLPNQYQPHPGRAVPYFLGGDQQTYVPDPWLTRHGEAPSHLNLSGHFPGATSTQGGDSFNRQAWMPSGYETTGFWPRYDYNRYQTNPDIAARTDPVLNSPVVNPPAPAITAPSVTLPNAGARFPTTAARDPLFSQSSSSTMPGSVALNMFPLDAYSSNRQERVDDFTTNRPFGSDQHGNRSLLSSETVSSRRQEERLRNNDALDLSQENSQAPSEDNSLVALERKVAEACAVVERVLKEREERTKRQREAAQRHRELREQREREARERREREQRETREREDTAMVELVPVQESPLWQCLCKHYQRRCSVRFPCCGVFYPCHRCHNGSGACDADDKKANQATHVKCANCGHEEEVSSLIKCFFLTSEPHTESCKNEKKQS